MHVVPLMTQMFARYEKNPSYPPIQILRETLTEEQLKAKNEFRGNSMQLILFYLWMIRFNKVAKRLAKIFINMCQRLKLYKVPKYNTIAVWMYILTGYISLRQSGSTRRMIKSCHNREMLATMVYALERLGDLVSNNFLHYFFYKGYLTQDIYQKVAHSYTRSINFAKNLYAFIKRRYLKHGNVAERLREANMREDLFQTLPRMSRDFRGFLNSYSLQPRAMVSLSTHSSSEYLARKLKERRMQIHSNESVQRPSIKPHAVYPKARIDIPSFIDKWSSCQFDDLILDINKIEDDEFRLTGGYESPPEDNFEDLLMEYYYRRGISPYRHTIVFRKSLARPEPKISVNSTFRKYARGRKSLYHSRLYIKKRSRRSPRRPAAPKKVKTLRSTFNKIEQLIIRRKRMPAPRLITRPRWHHHEPKDKTIKIKKNLTTVLREAASLLREEKKEQEKLLQILEGAPSYLEYEIRMQKRKKEDEKKRQEKIVEARLKAQLAYRAAILEKQRLLCRTKKKRLEFNVERKKLRHEMDANKLRTQRRKLVLKRKVQKARKRMVEKHVLMARKKNLEAAAASWKTYTLTCAAFERWKKVFKRKKRDIRIKNLLKKVARIQKREIKPLMDIEFQERKKLAQKHKLEEHGYKRKQIKQNRDFNLGVKKFAKQYVKIRRKRLLLRKKYALDQKPSLKNLAETPQDDPKRFITDLGNSILDSFSEQVENYSDIRSIALMREKLVGIRHTTSRMNNFVKRITGIRLEKNLTALEKASVNVQFVLALEKVKSDHDWYPAFQRTSSIRSRPSLSKTEFEVPGEMCEFSCEESTFSYEWDLIEMRQRKLEERQALIEEQAKYVSDIINAIEIYFQEFFRPPLTKRPSKKDQESEIKKLQQRLDYIKHEILETRFCLQHFVYQSESASRNPSTASLYYMFARDRFNDTPVLHDALRQIKFIKLNESRKKMLVGQRISKIDESQDDQSVISLPTHMLLAEIKLFSKRKQFHVRDKPKKSVTGEVKLTTDEEAYIKTQPPGYKLYTNQWGNPVYELKIKNEFKYMWEWVPIAIPKSAERLTYPTLKKAPYSLDQESIDSHDSALMLATKEHNTKYLPMDLFDISSIENKWKKKQHFAHLPKEVRKRYLNSVQKYVWEYYRNHPKGGRPEKLLVHIPLGEIQEEYLYFINKYKAKTSKRLKDKLRDIEKQLGTMQTIKKKIGKPDRRGV